MRFIASLPSHTTTGSAGSPGPLYFGPTTSVGEIVAYHRGDRVWTIDSLSFALQDQPVFLLDVVLPP